MSKKVSYPDCEYHRNIECSLYRRKCEKCGWNPKVEEARLKKIRVRAGLPVNRPKKKVEVDET